MKKNLAKEIEIPSGVEVSLNGKEVIIKGKEGEQKREFKLENIEIIKKDNKIILSSEKATKKEKKEMNTSVSHIKNMIEGIQKKFEYKLKVCASHFPMTLEPKGDKIIINNFLGETIPRVSRVIPGSEVKINKDIITVTSNNMEIAGQTAANFEKATFISKRDRRIFQDGIFITNKPKGEI